MRVGSVGYCAVQGLGRLLQAFFNNGVVTDPILWEHRQRRNHWNWYPDDTPRVPPQREIWRLPQVAAVLDRVQVMLFFETVFDWTLLVECRRRGIKTVLVPMYEWFPEHAEDLPDLFVCPSKLDLSYFPGLADGLRHQGVPSVFLPIPVRTDLWQRRTRVEHFLHSAGNVGHREHKGTREVLRAIPHITKPLTLTIRAQDGATTLRLMESIPFAERSGGAATVHFDIGERPYDDLYGTDYDVLIAPEKFNGLSLPLQEARAAGMVVMTSNRFPHNNWLPTEPLIPVDRYQKARVSRGCLEFDEAVIDPKAVAATMDAWYGRDITAYSEDGLDWAHKHSWESLKPKWLEVLAP